MIDLIGLTRVRNEEKIINNTLDFYSRWCRGIYVFDDASTDNTVAICKNHPSVIKVIENKVWSKDRLKAEYKHRQRLLEEGRKSNSKWFIYFDADERIEYDFKDLEQSDAIRMKLFDFYITEEDKHLPYFYRKKIGPEYREIIMVFRNNPEYKYHLPDQREITVTEDTKIKNTGYVKHYGKAISVEEWENTCEYYSKYFSEPYKSKWEKRKGKAIHTESDFGRELLDWEQRDDFGIKIG